MAAGLPVVATDISGNRDIVQDCKNGLLIQPADHTQLSEAVLCLLGSEGYRNRMGAKAKETANRYRWHEIARQYLEVYGEAQKMKKQEEEVTLFAFRGHPCGPNKAVAKCKMILLNS